MGQKFLLGMRGQPACSRGAWHILCDVAKGGTCAHVARRIRAGALARRQCRFFL